MKDKVVLADVCNKPVEIVVFDFDGTCINGNSPVILVHHLLREGLLQKRQGFNLSAWGFRYKFQLPQNENLPRSIVFSAFEGLPKNDVDEYLRCFYDAKLEGRFREMAQRAIDHHKDAGREIWLVSATFEPIAQRACEVRGFDHSFSTRMKVKPDGTYTREVEGLPVEGDEKLRLVRKYADEKFGLGNWVLEAAYGDHHSDGSMLEASNHPYAVCPDHPLARRAKQMGWTILDWKS